ncbi:MAG: CxxC-x17-CxxC domain-containing protein [Candidatus Micrarchaeota archaeon]
MDGDSGGQGGFRGGFGDRKMYKATCSDCGQECEVPFEPSPGKPVYCRNCYQKHRKPRSY